MKVSVLPAALVAVPAATLMAVAVGAPTSPGIAEFERSMAPLVGSQPAGLARDGQRPRTALHHVRRLPAGPTQSGANFITRDDEECCCTANVAQQLRNLPTCPVVREALEAGRLTLTGLYFDLAEARMVEDEALGAPRAIRVEAV